MNSLLKKLLFFIRLAILVVLAAQPLGQSAWAQGFPNHFDPNLRLERPDLSATASIRILATNNFPPFNFTLASGKLGGFNIDLARAICAELETKCSVQAWPFAQIADALADNQGDMIVGGLELNADNFERFDFSSVYMGFPARLVVRKDSAGGFDFAQLEGQQIAVRQGGVHAQYLRDHFADVEVSEFETEFEALDAVQGEGAFAYFGDAMRASFWLNENQACCQFVAEPFFAPSEFGHGLAMAFSPDRNSLRRAVNYALWRLNENGMLNELYLRWFPISFY